MQGVDAAAGVLIEQQARVGEPRAARASVEQSSAQLNERFCHGNNLAPNDAEVGCGDWASWPVMWTGVPGAGEDTRHQDRRCRVRPCEAGAEHGRKLACHGCSGEARELFTVFWGVVGMLFAAFASLLDNLRLWATVISQLLVIAVFLFSSIGFLWYNVIGCFALSALALSWKSPPVLAA